MALFIIGLALSGITAFPLIHELNLLCRFLGVSGARSPEGYFGLTWWILRVREGLVVTQAHYPFIAYGTDWLAFGHLIIALFFVGPLIDPVKNIWVLYAGLIACVAVIPLALVCGAIREIPFYWRLIDCSFGVIGFVPLWLALKFTKRLQHGILLVCVAMVFAVVPAHANLGESDAQMAARYGESQAQDKNPTDGLVTKCYSHDGYWIRVRFLDGSSQSEAFVKLNKEALSDQDITALLDANNRGSKWANIYKSAEVERWVLDSNAAVAHYYTKDHVLIITTRELMKFIGENGRLKEK